MCSSFSACILSLDEIASHHGIDEVYVHQIEVSSMDHAEIQFAAYDSVGVEFQWGLNNDVRRGEGAVIQDSSPLTCKFISKVDSPEELVVVEDSLCVDTSSWWDGYDDEEEPS